MKKIPTLFVRDQATHQLVPTVHPDAVWVLDGEGVATRKYDGMTVLIREGTAYKRITVKRTDLPPINWEPAQESADPETGEWPGWIPLSADSKEDRYLREAIESAPGGWEDGTYEAVGPKINGNPEGVLAHELTRHGADVLAEVPRDFDGLRLYLAGGVIEGIVWHHQDGRMVKIKGKDFGIRRAAQVKESANA